MPEKQRGKIRRGWEYLGHFHLFSWLFELAKPTLAPLVGIVTIRYGLLEQIPTAYLIAATCIAFASTMSAVNQVASWYNRNRQGYAYGVAYEGAHIGFDPNNINAALQIGVNFRNVSGRPILYNVDRFDIVIGNRTIPNPSFRTSGGIMPAGMGRRYSYPPFKKSDISEFLGKLPSGSIDFDLVYGNPDASAARRLKMRIEISLRLDDKFGIHDTILTESDQAA